MGNQHTAPIQYRTNDGLRISYHFYDLKGKNRFPDQPDDSQVDFMFERCLQQIDTEPSQLKEIKQFNYKYRYRFTILHKRKVEEERKNRQLEDLRRSSVQSHESEYLRKTQQKSKTKELQELIKQVQSSQTLIKVLLMKIDRYITQKYAHIEFIQIRGFERLLQLLEKAIKINAAGTKTNFSNQIEILKFFKLFSDRYPKDFYNYIPSIKNYPSVIIRTYHPVNTHITTYCLNLMTDYLWRVQEGDHIIKILEQFRLENGYETFLSPFADTINSTDNILMAFYNMKFLNELIASIIEEDHREQLKQNLTFVKYGYVLDGIKGKLQQNYFNLENTTFISMHQKIFKYATQNNKIQKKQFEENRVSYRNTFNLTALHSQILKKLLDNDNQTQEEENDDKSEQSIVAFLAESDRKSFNKFILDTLTELQKYSKLEFQLQNSSKNGQFLQETQQMVESKIYLTNVENYFSRIKQACTKNNCNEIMTNCFKNLQYFQKSQWKHLERFVLQELGLEKKVTDQLEELKKTLDEKQTMIKRIIKQNIDLRNQLTELRMKDGNYSQRNIGKLNQQSKQFLQTNIEKMNHSMQQIKFSKKSINLPSPPSGNLKGKLQLPKMPASLGKFLNKIEQLPSPPKKLKQEDKPMRDRPKLNIQSQNVGLSTAQTGLNNVNVNNSSTQLNNISQLPPSLMVGVQLPPPQTLGLTSLPPPPSLGTSLPSLPGSILPPPPSLGSFILPPPPTLGLGVLPSSLILLPPPPSLGTTNLPPPPPAFNGTILPPPPAFNSAILPPPPAFNSSILPPPPSFNSSILPPPPSIGSLILPPPLGGGLMPPPLGPMSNLPMPGFEYPTQKIKQKRKPKVPLKACNYTTIQYDKIVGTIFQDIDDTTLQWNEDQLIQLFAKTGPQSSTLIKQPSDDMKTNASIQPIKQVVKFLGSDRWRNSQIILTKLRILPGEVTQALTQCTGKFTSQSNLQSILKLSPNEEQQQMIKTYEGSVQDLGKPERFMKQLIEIPEYVSRIKSMIFSNMKEEFFYELSSKIQQFQSAFTSLRVNKRLKQVILICLGLGNYLNGTTLKGGAWGFKIQTMQRLEEIKTNDNKMNAAFYLIKQIWKQYPYPIFDKQQIDLYQYVSKMSISQVNQQLGQLRVYHKAIEKAFKSHNKNNPKDQIGPYCEEVMMQASIKLQQYKQSTQKINQLYLDCAKYYCEDGSKLSSDQFGKKMFQSILFISNTQKMFKVIEDKRIKDQNRKAAKNQITYTEVTNPESLHKTFSKTLEKPEIQKITPIKILPQPPQQLPKLPLPPKSINKEQKLKEIEKIQQEREKKALQQVMMRRTSKLQAYRMSKMSQVNTKKSAQQIDFLRGIK